MRRLRLGRLASWQTGLWRHPDFVRLWAGATISVFGSLITRTALPFTAILVLDATPIQISLLAIAELVPGFLIGLIAGVWVDRLPRRAIMIITDLARAAFLLTIPLAALFDRLTLEQLYTVAALNAIGSAFFDVAYLSYLPTLVRREELIEGNSKLTASASAAEFTAFSTGGWLVQLLTAPIAILVDSLSFLISAFFIRRIQTPEPPPAPATNRLSAIREIEEGLRLVAHQPTLRALASAGILIAAAFRVYGAVFLLFVTRELGLAPGIQGLIFGIGGLSSLAGAVLVARLTRRFGLGPTLIGALVAAAIGQLFVPVAGGPLAVIVLLLVAQQLVTDPAMTVFDISQTSLRQAITPDRFQGRMNASMRVLEFGGMLLGAVAGGLLGETIGLRATLFAGIGVTFLAALTLALTPLRSITREPASPLTTDP